MQAIAMDKGLVMCRSLVCVAAAEGMRRCCLPLRRTTDAGIRRPDDAPPGIVRSCCVLVAAYALDSMRETGAVYVQRLVFVVAAMQRASRA
jgi:hypothetical protein